MEWRVGWGSELSSMQSNCVCRDVEGEFTVSNNWIGCNSKRFTCLLYFFFGFRKNFHLLFKWNKAISKILLKVACVVNIKLGFMDWIFCYLLMAIKWYKLQYKSFDKALLFLRPGILSQKLKTLTSSNYHKVFV